MLMARAFSKRHFPTGGLHPAHEEQHAGNGRAGVGFVGCAVVCLPGDSRSHIAGTG